MLKRILTLALLLAVLPLKAETDFRRADELFKNASYRESLEALKALDAQTSKEKVALLWRLSRVNLLLGEEASGTDAKRAFYAEGIASAEEGIALDPSSVECHMWHSANVGRDCQTRDIMKQAGAVPTMMADLTTILEKIGADNCSEAWQALGEIYFNHPFKSTDAAINFGRKALSCIPAGELRLSTYTFLARMLLSRDRSAAKRCAEITDGAKALQKEKGGIGRGSRFASQLGADFKPAWSSKTLGEMSDKEEAEAIIKYAAELYKKAAVHYPTDDKDYKELISIK